MGAAKSFARKAFVLRARKLKQKIQKADTERVQNTRIVMGAPEKPKVRVIRAFPHGTKDTLVSDRAAWKARIEARYAKSQNLSVEG